MSDTLGFILLACMYFGSIMFASDIGYYRGRRSVWEEIQRQHLEDDEALKRASGQE